MSGNQPNSDQRGFHRFPDYFPFLTSSINRPYASFHCEVFSGSYRCIVDEARTISRICPNEPTVPLDATASESSEKQWLRLTVIAQQHNIVKPRPSNLWWKAQRRSPLLDPERSSSGMQPARGFCAVNGNVLVSPSGFRDRHRATFEEVG